MTQTYTAHVISLITARSGRNMDRGRRAAEAVKAAGGTAMDAALAQIGTTFDSAAKNNTFKLRVLNWMRLGADHPAVQARFGRRAGMLRGQTIDGAICLANRWYRDECDSMAFEIIRELRLLLRLIRFAGHGDQFPYIVGVVLGGDIESRAHLAELGEGA